MTRKLDKFWLLLGGWIVLWFVILGFVEGWRTAAVDVAESAVSAAIFGGAILVAVVVYRRCRR